MNKHVAFRMPLRVLLRAAQRGDFREVLQPARLLEHGPATSDQAAP